MHCLPLPQQQLNHCAGSHSTGASFFLKKLLNLARKRHQQAVLVCRQTSPLSVDDISVLGRQANWKWQPKGLLHTECVFVFSKEFARVWLGAVGAAPTACKRGKERWYKRVVHLVLL